MGNEQSRARMKNGAILVLLFGGIVYSLNTNRSALESLLGYGAGMESNLPSNQMESLNLEPIPVSAKNEFNQGMEFLEQGDTTNAISKLESAYTLQPHASVLFNISRAHERQGNLTQAIDYLERYLNSGPEDAYLVEEHLRALHSRNSGE